jgi:proline iminopeptidase
MPVLLALGRYDYLVPPAYLWEGVRDKFSNLTIRIFEKSSHAPHLEEPELFDKELLEWLFNLS